MTVASAAGARDDAARRVILTLDAVTAEAVAAWGRLQHGFPPFVVNPARGGESSDCDERLQSDGVSVANRGLTRWRAWTEERGKRVDRLYVRPEVLRLKTLLRELPSAASPRRDFAIRRILALDAELAGGPTISLETLYFQPRAATAALCAWLGQPSVAGDDFGGETAHRAAMSEILARLREGDVETWVGGIDFEPDEPHSVARDRDGFLCLGKGWSWPEQDFTWSDGPSASLIIPHGEVHPGRKGRIELELTGRPERYPFLAGLWAGARQVLDVELLEPPSGPVTLKATLPSALLGSCIGVIDVRLEVSTLREPPANDPLADPRRLGFALETFQLRTCAYAAELAELASLCRAPERGDVLSLGQPPPSTVTDFLGWLADEGVNELTAPSSPHDGEPLSKDASGLRIRGLSGRESQPDPLAILAERQSVFGLLVLWDADLLGLALDALRRRRWSPSTPAPDIAVFTGDPAVFNRVWWSHMAGFEMEAFGADLRIGAHWTVFRTGRRM